VVSRAIVVDHSLLRRRQLTDGLEQRIELGGEVTGDHRGAVRSFSSSRVKS